MLSEPKIEFTKDNIDLYLKEVAKEYRRAVKKGMHAELILIGGASILINYGFRNMTTDIDSLIFAASSMKDAINKVRDRYGLPNGWLNEDFKRTDSYTPRLAQFSVYYRTYSNILTIRTVAAEHLIAMKLRSGRRYKSDLSDIIGILAEHEKKGAPITLEMVRRAVSDLYGEWESISSESRLFIENIMQQGNFEQIYKHVKDDENETKKLMVHFENSYPGVTKKNNVDTIIDSLQKKANKEDILMLLRQKADNPEN